MYVSLFQQSINQQVLYNVLYLLLKYPAMDLYM